MMSVFFYICGGLCLFKTRMLIGWAQRNYHRGKFAKLAGASAFSDMVTKPWYPVIIRCAGIFICLWALTIDYLVLFRGFH
jgi:hypothetical protein